MSGSGLGWVWVRVLGPVRVLVRIWVHVESGAGPGPVWVRVWVGSGFSTDPRSGSPDVRKGEAVHDRRRSRISLIILN